MRISADVLLVGSVPLESGEEVMRTCGRSLGEMVVGLPDGETGDRIVWVTYQAYRVFHEHPQLETVQRPAPVDGLQQWMPKGLDDMWSFRIRDGVDDLRFDDLRYASVARDSYATFKALRDAGDIAPGVRFQVSLPFPESGACWWFQDPEQLARVVPAYADAMRREAEQIFDAIPHEDLVLQWDVCWEVLDVEGIFPWTMTEPPPQERFERMVAQLAPSIPEDVLLGYHLCYADLGHKHMKEPEDLGLCVAMANAAVANSGRRVDFFHMPVPRGRDDDAYFAPLGGLDVAEAKVFLGLVHHTDGEQGTRRRVAAAHSHLAGFGIATECGFGRRPPEHVPDLLDIHKAVAGELRSTTG